MRVRRIFLVFSVSISLFAIFLFVVFYNTFVKGIRGKIEFLESKYVSSYLNSMYISAKYNLQNIVRDKSYKPNLPLMIYNKQSKEINGLGLKEIDENIKRFFYENLSSAVFMEDGFGYLPPYSLQNRLNILILLEKGEDIYVATIKFDLSLSSLKLCIVGVEQFKGISNIECKSAPNEGKQILNLRAYEFRYNKEDVLFDRSLILLFGLSILVGLVFSFWVSRHFDLEEERLISEINSAIENVISGRIHLLNVKSVYSSFACIIEGINKLITEMSSQIDKYRSVYDEYFKMLEKDKTVSESRAVIMNYLCSPEGLSNTNDILKALDIFLHLNGGGLRYIGRPESDADLIVPVHLILGLVRTKKAFKLIIEFGRSFIEIRSENNDFDVELLKSYLISENIELNHNKITIKKPSLRLSR